MSLRSLILAIIVVGALGGSTLVYFESSVLVGHEFNKIAKEQAEAVGKLANSALSAEVLRSQKLSSKINAGSLFGRLVLKPGSQPVTSNKLVELIDERSCDATAIITRDGVSTFGGAPFDLNQRNVVEALGEKTSFAIGLVDSKQTLVSYIPIFLYLDAVAVLVCSRDIEAAVNATLGADSGVNVSVLKQPTGNGLRLAHDRIAGSVEIEISSKAVATGKQKSQARTLIIGLLAILGLVTLIFGILNYYFVRSFEATVQALRSLSNSLNGGVVPTIEPKKFAISELSSMSQATSELAQSIFNFNKQIALKTRTEAIGEKAAQVAHDIKGPLAALRMAMESAVRELPTAQRQAIEALVTRIGLVAQDVPTTQQEISSSPIGLFELHQIVESVLAEKTLQYSDRRLNLRSIDSSERSIWVNADETQLRRVLSNLIDNSIEASSSEADVVVRLDLEDSNAKISVSDSGNGFSKQALSNFAVRGFSHSKQDGSGLGLWHAAEFAKSLGGGLQARNAQYPERGALVELMLPTTQQPSWHRDTIFIDSRFPVVVVDDDPGVHQMWEARLAQFEDLKIFHFSSGHELIQWTRSNSQAVLRSTVFCDYDLKDRLWNGLDLLSEIGCENAYLVTASFLDQKIRLECEHRSIGLIDKLAIERIRLRVEATKQSKFKAGALLALLAALQSSFGFSADDRALDRIRRIEVNVSDSSKPFSKDLRTVSVTVDVSQMAPASRLDPSLVYNAIKSSLSKSGLVAVRGADINASLRKGTLDVLSERALIVDVSSELESRGTFRVVYSLGFVKYERVDAKLVPTVVWERRQESLGVAGRQIERLVFEYLQGEMPEGAKVLRASPSISHHSSSARASVSTSHSVSWVDPDGKRNRPFIGVSLGTPAMFNINVGYWGSTRVPIYLELSGMYFDDDRRGFTAQAGWIFDNTGIVRQAICASLQGVGESYSSSSDELDVLGRPTRRTTTTNYFISPYLGPSYLLEYRNVQFNIGVGAALSATAHASFRGVLQLGYTLPVGF